MEKLIEIKNLRTSFFTLGGEVKAVNDVSFHVNKGEIVAVFYRYIVKNFFGYCQVLDEESNRELDYEF